MTKSVDELYYTVQYLECCTADRWRTVAIINNDTEMVYTRMFLGQYMQYGLAHTEQTVQYLARLYSSTLRTSVSFRRSSKMVDYSKWKDLDSGDSDSEDDARGGASSVIARKKSALVPAVRGSSKLGSGDSTVATKRDDDKTRLLEQVERLRWVECD